MSFSVFQECLICYIISGSNFKSVKNLLYSLGHLGMCLPVGMSECIIFCFVRMTLNNTKLHDMKFPLGIRQSNAIGN